MKKWTSIQYSRLLSVTVLVGLPVFVLAAEQAGVAENAVESAVSPVANVQKVVAARPAGEQGAAEYVSINVDGGSLVQVLNAFAIQTGRNIVVGPNVVVTNGVNLHLNNVRWDEALDVILKPYGFGYRKVGDTLVVSRMSEISALTAIEPLETKVFNLKYLDASDVQNIIKGQLSARGTSTVAVVRGMKGWKNDSGGGSRSGSSANSLQVVRVEDKMDDAERVRSKTLIVTDVPGSLVRIGEVLAKLDTRQQQIQVEARFMEVNQALLKDAGLDFTSVGLEAAVKSSGESGRADGSAGSDGNFNSLTWNAGTVDAKATINFLQKDDDTKVLSAPRILTLNNQEATIMVGQKYPILRTDLGSGTSTIATTTLDYYENIGIQLNVVPQICADGYINMIVRPVVSSIAGRAKGQGDIDSPFPIINTRETETQILLKTGETGVIGGLLEERKKAGVQKIPVLGSIPLIGRLFRNETADNQTIDLLIFLTATIITTDNQNALIGENGKSGMNPPVTITVPPAPTKMPEAVEAPPVFAPVR
ncbi:MAG: secretin and TonB N-terminal domain-containing protein [Kiritimatiellales bacterium]